MSHESFSIYSDQYFPLKLSLVFGVYLKVLSKMYPATSYNVNLRK